jgi:hypothetical protein
VRDEVGLVVCLGGSCSGGTKYEPLDLHFWPIWGIEVVFLVNVWAGIPLLCFHSRSRRLMRT